MMLFVRGRIIPEHRNPVNRLLIWIYRPVIRSRCDSRPLTIADRARVLLAQPVAGIAARQRVHADSQ